MAQSAIRKKLAKSWSEMKQRCTNQNHNRYHRYCGRGITFSKDWEDINNFIRDMEPSYVFGYSLDRIDNNGNYCKENCRWSNTKTQCRNRSTNRLITYKNKTLTLVEWSELLKIKRTTITQRLDYYKWSLEKALSK